MKSGPQTSARAAADDDLVLHLHLTVAPARLQLRLFDRNSQRTAASAVVFPLRRSDSGRCQLAVHWTPDDPALPGTVQPEWIQEQPLVSQVHRLYKPAEVILWATRGTGDREVSGRFTLTNTWRPWMSRMLSWWACEHEPKGPDADASLGADYSLAAFVERFLKFTPAPAPPPREHAPASRPRGRRKQPPEPTPDAHSHPGDARPTEAPATPPPEVDVLWDPPSLDLKPCPGVERSAARWDLHELAARWWVSNQTDELLCLPHCSIERLEYQVRAALRVIGALRGRALLSDEVGLGKTVEAGLVLKEYLVRGMVRKFLVITQPSLVDQWAEELAAKFNIPVVTTHGPEFRNDPTTFWKQHPGIVASLALVRQPGHRPAVQAEPWDMLVVDEAHHLRNRSSLSWETVSGLTRKFLLLLSATPVQNSLEELYNLVTLLQPGQLASPKEFRARFMDPRRPRQPKEPEELRRLLGQVMVRNTRANSGIQLPPRRAETALFQPDPAEALALQSWEGELREALATLPPAQASLWGRLLLQAAGSSPNALRSALANFPDRQRSARWSDALLLASAWRRKCDLLPPIAAGEGGVVVFTQFLATQQALAESLAAARVPAFVINGSTPSAQRQPIVEDFRRRGGALVLTQSGTEGRNLQFCHRMVNFDLPWNPMEIEQRIGRLHRIGQRHPVRIHNFVQAGTLQERLLVVLQEKLNLFELVVGETGLILGDRFGEEDFAEEVLRRWRDGADGLDKAFADLGATLASARDDYREIQQLDSTLFAQDYADL